jgi:hypothetical protein
MYWLPTHIKNKHYSVIFFIGLQLVNLNSLFTFKLVVYVCNLSNVFFIHNRLYYTFVTQTRLTLIHSYLCIGLQLKFFSRIFPSDIALCNLFASRSLLVEPGDVVFILYTHLHIQAFKINYENMLCAM